LGVVIAPNDVDVRVGALSARMVADQVQIAEPQPAQPTHTAVMQPGDDHDVARGGQHTRLREGLPRLRRVRTAGGAQFFSVPMDSPRPLAETSRAARQHRPT
jgi:hypothetical protein